jgi:hypothetical protein
MITRTNPTTSTQTSTPKETKPDAAALWATTIQALEAYKRECDQLDRESSVVDG